MVPGVARIDLIGHLPVVEHRKSVDRFFVVYPDLDVELVMGFVHRWTACELAINTYAGTPFYTMIPVVPYQTVYPRPWMEYPSLIIQQVELRFSED